MDQKLIAEIDTNNKLSQCKAHIPALESLDAEITEKLSEKR
jgi:hypothetical protein